MATERFFERFRRVLGAPADGAGLAAFRVLLGCLLVVSALRFVRRGWVEALYLAPSYHFPYAGFSWVMPLGAYTYGLFAALALSGVALALGFQTRIAAGVACALFTYLELIDKALYLNHYYLVSLLTFLCAVLPVGAAFSLDARRQAATHTVPALAYYVLRAQVALVYVYAGLAKLNPDWLFEAMPLELWLATHAGLPVVGSLLALPVTAFVMSWAGALFDLGIVPLLVWRRTRALGVALALVFHGAIGLLFPVGVFSLVMLVAVTVFFDHSWPRRFWRRGGAAAAGGDAPGVGRAAFTFAAIYLLIQLLLPLRCLLYPGPVNWTEEGFRFAWRVMLVEKAGHAEFRVVSERPARHFSVTPREELTPLQAGMMATQADMLVDYARHLRERYEARGWTGVKVFADVFVAYNGRPSQRFVRADVDLSRARCVISACDFILPLQSPDQPSSTR
jgi:vitamin K-dependent gamma-carboxylase